MKAKMEVLSKMNGIYIEGLDNRYYTQQQQYEQQYNQYYNGGDYESR